MFQPIVTSRPALALILIFFAAAAGTAQPRIELEPGHLAFGDIPHNETRTAMVTVRNTGDQALRIDSLRPNCYCIEATLQVRDLAPLESVTMEVLFNTTGFQGPQHKHIRITSNDPHNGMIDFAVTADIKVPLLMTPQHTMLMFQSLRAGQTRTITYAFESDEVDRLDIEPLAWPSQWLDITVEPGDSPRRVEIHFTARPDGPVRRYRDTVRLATNVPAAPRVDLEVAASVAADLVLNMERLNLGAVPPERVLEYRVQVSPLELGLSFKLTGAEIDIPGLRAEVINEGTTGIAIIEGRALARDHPKALENQGRIQGTLRIFSDLESTPELQVPVSYILRR